MFASVTSNRESDPNHIISHSGHSTVQILFVLSERSKDDREGLYNAET